MFNLTLIYQPASKVYAQAHLVTDPRGFIGWYPREFAAYVHACYHR